MPFPISKSRVGGEIIAVEKNTRVVLVARAVALRSERSEPERKERKDKERARREKKKKKGLIVIWSSEVFPVVFWATLYVENWNKYLRFVLRIYARI